MYSRLTSPVSGDYLKWFQIALRYEVDYTDGPVAEYTVHPGGISRDLGASLRARIRLFSDELARTDDVGTRDILRQLLFNLALHVGGAALRGRARPTGKALSLAAGTAAVAGGSASAWTAAFAYHHLRIRYRRLAHGR